MKTLISCVLRAHVPLTPFKGSSSGTMKYLKMPASIGFVFLLTHYLDVFRSLWLLISYPIFLIQCTFPSHDSVKRSKLELALMRFINSRSSLQRCHCLKYFGKNIFIFSSYLYDNNTFFLVTMKTLQLCHALNELEEPLY